MLQLKAHSRVTPGFCTESTCARLVKSAKDGSDSAAEETCKAQDSGGESRSIKEMIRQGRQPHQNALGELFPNFLPGRLPIKYPAGAEKTLHASWLLLYFLPPPYQAEKRAWGGDLTSGQNSSLLGQRWERPILRAAGPRRNVTGSNCTTGREH